ncbi:MAG TPA: FecR domain-containing protein [Acidimicrobiales bacterium]|nr:FecR domain-containing protein [Acidimicrobiales bacterium]
MAGPRALHEGDDVLAGAESVAELEHFDGSSTRLDANATAALDRIADPDGRPHLVLRLGPGNSFHRTAPDRSRRGQYEARTPTAAALARNATFVARCAADGASEFTVLTGTVVVRGTTGGTVVLRAGEAVTVAADGAVGDVSSAGDDALADDEWIAVNAWLDAEAAPPPEPEPAPEPELEPEPEPAAAAPEDRPIFIPEPDDHPWKVGVAAAVAISIGIFSVIIGRAGSARPVDNSADPDIAVPGPPAFSSPAYTAPGPAMTAPPTTEVAAPPTTTAPAVPAAAASVDTGAYDVASKSCSRGGTNVITFTGALRNKSSAPHTYSVRVKFSGPRNDTVTTVTTTVEVPAGTTKTFRVSTPPLRNAAAATACDADRVDVVS